MNSQVTRRIQSIDIVRGIVMIIMALDHVRDLIHVDSILHSPTDLNTTTPLLFLTRLITHLCAPTFVFLAGASAYLSVHKTGIITNKKLFLNRGLILILLEFTVVTFGIWFDIHFRVLLFGVIAAIGVGFLIICRMMHLDRKVHLTLGLAILILHNLLPVIIPPGSLIATIFNPLFAPGAYPIGPLTFVMGYSPVPWLGIMLTGYGLGSVFENAVEVRRKFFLKTGIISLISFFLLRWINYYGDPVPWSSESNSYTWMSFFNVNKYPPSLLFCLLTLGVMFLLLYMAESIRNRFTTILQTYGKVPLFYFLTHWYIIHPLMFLIVFAQGYNISQLRFGFNFGRPEGQSGLGLAGVYLIWFVVVLLMFPLCSWYGRYKQKNPQKSWLKYI